MVNGTRTAAVSELSSNLPELEWHVVHRIDELWRSFHGWAEATSHSSHIRCCQQLLSSHTENGRDVFSNRLHTMCILFTVTFYLCVLPSEGTLLALLFRIKANKQAKVRGPAIPNSSEVAHLPLLLEDSRQLALGWRNRNDRPDLQGED